MTTSVSAEAVGTRIARWISLVGDASRRLTRWHFLAALAVGAAVSLWDSLIGIDKLFEHPEFRLAHLSDFLHHEFIALVLLLAVAIADRAVDVGRARRSAYVLAIIVAIGLGTPLAYAVDPPWGRWLPSTLYNMMCWLMFGGLATFVYVDRKRARATRARLATAELERTRKAKHMLESRLAAMQARVEPRFLFNTLAQVQHLYQANPALGERMLDELIAYLRAAMPRMRDTSSTLLQEIELARAYLAIVKVRLGDRLDYVIDMPNDIGDARLPPMMLLPLIDHAVVHGIEQAKTSATIRITADITDGRLRVAMVDSGAGFMPAAAAGGDGIASIRERLSALYGHHASLALRAGDHGTTEAVMEIPHEPAPHGQESTP